MCRVSEIVLSCRLWCAVWPSYYLRVLSTGMEGCSGGDRRLMAVRYCSRGGENDEETFLRRNYYAKAEWFELYTTGMTSTLPSPYSLGVLGIWSHQPMVILLPLILRQVDLG